MRKFFISIIIVASLLIIGTFINRNKDTKASIYIKNDTINFRKELFTDEELKWIEKYKNQDICVGVADDYTPIEYIDKNGEPKGIGIEIIKRVNQVTGLKFKMYEDSSKENWKEILKSTAEKKIDMLTAVSFTEGRSKYLDYSIPYIEMTQVILGHKDNPNLFNDIRQNDDKIFVVPKGYWFLDIILKANPNAKVIEVENMKKGLEYVSNKKADYTLSDIPVFSYYKEQGAYNNIKIIGELKQKNHVFIAVRKDFSQLIPIINKVIQNTDYNELYEKAFIMPQNNSREKKLIFLSTLLIILLLIVVCYLYMTFIKLIEAKKEAEEANKDKTKLMTNLSHDLRTPITVVIGYAQAIIDEEARKEDKERYIKKIYDKAKYLNNIVNDFFLISRLEERRFILHREEIKLNSFINNIVQGVALKAETKNIHIILELDKSENINKKVDRLKLHRAIENIVINAIKYSNKDDCINISTQLIKKGKVKISIKDNGEGIHKEDIPYVFDRYYKGKNSKRDSIGLGLYIAKEIIDKHNGKVWVESELNKGATFHIVI